VDRWGDGATQHQAIGLRFALRNALTPTGSLAVTLGEDFPGSEKYPEVEQPPVIHYLPLYVDDGQSHKVASTFAAVLSLIML